MTQIAINAQDVANAANFLEQFLSDAVSDGDFSKGTALRDLAVGAIAAIYAFLQRENTNVRQLQSLTSVETAVGADPVALQDAVAAILSNFFITAKDGSKSRGFAIGHATTLTDIFIPTTIKFTRAPGLVFVVDSTETLFVPQNELVPIVDASNVVLDYEFRIPLVAVSTGDAYDIDPGFFSAFDRFNPYVTRIENPEQFAGGKGPETVTEVLARAPTAISVRNLINERSIDAVLHDTFAEIRQLFVAGMGTPEMQRDRIQGVAPHLALHVGGMVDIYLLLDLVEASFTGTVGDLFARPDGVASVLRDGSNSFAAVVPGDVIRITAGLPVVPAEFLVIENGGDTLVVSERAPFAIPTDEAVPAQTVSYTVGRIGPNYNDVLAALGGVPLTTGLTSRRVGRSGRITMPGGPVMDILDVAIVNPPNTEAAFKSNLDGFVHFPSHINSTPQDGASTVALQFKTVMHNPLYAQSMLQWLELQVGTEQTVNRFDGYLLRVRYRTLSAFTVIDSFVRGRRERTAAAFQLPRGHHPIEVQIDIAYKLKSSATVLLDNGVIAKTVSDYINAYDTSVSPIDTSGIETLLRTTFPTMQSILPLVINYILFAPTGDLVSYQTVDEVRLEAGKQVSGPVLDLLGFGVSDRTVRYISNTTVIRAQRVA